MPHPVDPRTAFARLRRRPVRGLAVLLATGCAAGAGGSGIDFLSDLARAGRLHHSQQWGTFGLDIAARGTGPRQPIRIGDKNYAKGLGHHAGGRIDVDLAGRYTSFRTAIGVQWQGGGRGSVRFEIRVDDKQVFVHGPMSDSDPAMEVDIPLVGADRLALLADPTGDGISCDMATWAEARLLRDPLVPFFGAVSATLGGRPAPPPSAAVCGLSMIALPQGPRLLVTEPYGTLTAVLEEGREVRLSVPVENLRRPIRVAVDVVGVDGARLEAGLAIEGGGSRTAFTGNETTTLEAECANTAERTTLVLSARGQAAEAGIRWRNLRYRQAERWIPVPLRFDRPVEDTFPPPTLPDPSPLVERELLERDWRMQDGIGTPRSPVSWRDAVRELFRRGDRLVAYLAERRTELGDLPEKWAACRVRYTELAAEDGAPETEWEELWRRVHRVRRDIVFANPAARTGPLVFAKRVPAVFSHQLTQYYGRCSRPGGGLFVLEEPGRNMRCRPIGAGALPMGSYQHPEVSFDGKRVLFAYCETNPDETDWRTSTQVYNLYEIGLDGSGPRQVTSGPYDDFAGRYLPDGRILFTSTRRGGFHRCGRGPCPVYTLAAVDADGSNLRVLSPHETHEWDPAVLNDGRIIYTRWDYVDRHAVHYQQLWTARPDGTNPSIFFGNHTLNPVGIWEARAVPGSTRIMATAGAHHAMTAGSIILLDVRKGVDGLNPITRLTPDVLFPESEAPVQHWRAPVGVKEQPPTPPEQKRWPGHCYRSPYPLSESVFLAAYSFDALIGEPGANPTNMFGLYLVDRFGNKELLYRDLNISSVWPTPLRPRIRPPRVPRVAESAKPGDDMEGSFYIRNVYRAYPPLPTGPENRVARLRILQVLPKTTPNANSPRVGQANASPGKQVLGTVPVEADGSAYFRAPANLPLQFQVLDSRGRAIQSMRSLTYLQPGENAACVGCHESRHAAAAVGGKAAALARAPSTLAPGPSGSNPFSYPLLVQPVLDRHCVSCHDGAKAPEGVRLTGEPEGPFTRSYNQLVKRVPYSEWQGGDFRTKNSEPLARPDVFGARASKLMDKLLAGHKDVKLTEDDIERLATWMDTTALFYGTFLPADQARQRRGEAIAGPGLE